LLKAMEEASELQAISHAGSRQLAATAGLFPPGVNIPEWIQYGWGSFFETPREAFWPGTAAPHWRNLLFFKIYDLIQAELTPEEAMKRTVTDYFYRNPSKTLLSTADLEVRTVPFGQFKCMSWSLVYFLAHQHLDGLVRYSEELNKLPRHMELGEDVLLLTFA